MSQSITEECSELVSSIAEVTLDSMSRTRKHPKRRTPFNPVKTFFKVMLSIVMVFVVLAGGACFAYHKVTGEWPFGGDTIAKDADETSMLDALLGRNMKLNVSV